MILIVVVSFLVAPLVFGRYLQHSVACNYFIQELSLVEIYYIAIFQLTVSLMSLSKCSFCLFVVPIWKGCNGTQVTYAPTSHSVTMYNTTCRTCTSNRCADPLIHIIPITDGLDLLELHLGATSIFKA